MSSLWVSHSNSWIFFQENISWTIHSRLVLSRHCHPSWACMKPFKWDVYPKQSGAIPLLTCWFIVCVAHRIPMRVRPILVGRSYPWPEKVFWSGTSACMSPASAHTIIIRGDWLMISLIRVQLLARYSQGMVSKETSDFSLRSEPRPLFVFQVFTSRSAALLLWIPHIILIFVSFVLYSSI